MNDFLLCITCNQPLQEAIFNQHSWSLLLKLTLPFPALGLLVVFILKNEKHNTELKVNPVGIYVHTVATLKMPLVAGTLLGMGLGGFLDGILLHQVLQWHQMISNQLPPDTLFAKNINMFWDGIFHVFTWILTFTGLVLLWKSFQKEKILLSDRLLVGSLLLGWGIFNVLDSIFNHYLFELHNIRENAANPQMYNHIFLVFGIILMVAGYMVIRSMFFKKNKMV
jgi:uncharacterized membrane protein